MNLLTVLVAAPLLAFAQDASTHPVGADAAEAAEAAAVRSVADRHSDTTRESRRHRLERPAYALPPGKIEIGGFFGGNVFAGTVQANPSLGGELVLGLPHGFGVFGETAWNRLLRLDLPGGHVGVALYDLGAGLQWSPFHWGRLAPYLRGGVSWLRLGGGGRFGREEFATSIDRLGGTLGFGSRIYLNERCGVLVEVGAVHAWSYNWLGRFSTGFFYHFK